jgi:hypothetical protein
MENAVSMPDAVFEGDLSTLETFKKLSLLVAIIVAAWKFRHIGVS